MGVPAHDSRDFEFARTFNLPIKPVLVPEGATEKVLTAVTEGEISWTESGIMLPMAHPVAAELALDRERAERARAALGRLKPSEREAVMLRYEAELSFGEVAQAMAIDEAAARKRVSRALARLREDLGRE